MQLLLLKIVLSAGLVIATTATAERFGPRLGGIAGSFPQLAVVSLVFFGLEQGLAFAAESAFWNIPGVCAGLPFYIGYVVGAGLVPQHRMRSIASGAAVGTISWIATALVLSAIHIGRATVVPLAVVMCGSALWWVRRLPDTAPFKPVRTSVQLIAARAGLASIAIIVITAVAHLLGPKWSGLVTGYPVNGLPIIVALHFHYGLEVIRAMVKVWPVGVFGICLFDLVAWLAVARLGIVSTIALGYATDITYLVLADAVRRTRL